MEYQASEKTATTHTHIQEAHFSFIHLFSQLQSSCVKGAFPTLEAFVEHKVTKSAVHTLTWIVTGLL